MPAHARAEMTSFETAVVGPPFWPASPHWLGRVSRAKEPKWSGFHALVGRPKYMRKPNTIMWRLFTSARTPRRTCYLNGEHRVPVCFLPKDPSSFPESEPLMRIIDPPRAHVTEVKIIPEDPPACLAELNPCIDNENCLPGYFGFTRKCSLSSVQDRRSKHAFIQSS